MRWIVVFGIIGLPCLALAAEPRQAAGIPPAPAVATTRLKLEECVAIALSNHPSLAEASARIDEAHGQVVQARLYPNPRIDSGNPQTIGPKKTGIYTTGLTQEIVRGGKLKLDQSAAFEASRQTEWDAVRRRYEILTLVRQEFFSTLAAQRKTSLLEKQQQIAKRSENIAEQRFKGGEASGADHLSLRVERRRIDIALQSARFDLLGSRRQLAATLGLTEAQLEAVDGSLTVDVPAFDNEDVLAQAVQSNPALQIANLDISRTLYLLRRAEVEPIPNVTLQGGTQYSESTNNFQGLLGVYVSVPIFNKNQGNIFSANAAVRRASATRQSVQQSLTKQLAAALIRFRESDRAVSTFNDEIIPDATQTLTIVQEGYSGGTMDLERLIQVQKTFFEVNLDYVSALENRLLSASEIAGLLQLDQFP